MKLMTSRIALVLIFVALATARADGPRQPGDVKAPLGLPPEALDVGIDQRLGERVPLGLVFKDEGGAEVRLGDFFDKKPVILVMAYYRCPMLCTQVLNGLAESLRAVRLTPGKDFEVVVVSFDPSEKPALAAAKKASYAEQYGQNGTADGWHFLTGEQGPIDDLCGAVGFRKVYDQKHEQFIHASGIMVLTPGGKLARYLFGIRFAARDLQLALVEASEEKVGGLADRLVLLCFHYDPASGQYTLAIMNVVRVAGALTVLALLGFICLARPWRRAAPAPGQGGVS